jgi:hypothetical protein
MCFFPLEPSLYCGTNFLSIKHVDVPKSRSAWTSIVTSLLHLTIIGTNKFGFEFKNKLGPFSLHDASRSNLAIPIKIGHAYRLKEMKGLTFIYTPLGT